MSNKYVRDVSHIKKLDPYRLQELYGMHPCAEHVVKKLMIPGERSGGKSLDEDILDCIQTLERWREMRAEDAAYAANRIDTTCEATPVATLYDWRTVPAQFQWMATNADGHVFAYLEKPEIGAPPYWGSSPGSLRMQGISAAKADWRESLERRP